MAVSYDMEVVGVKNALRELRQFNRPLSNELRRNARKIMAPIVADAQRQIPSRALSGWDNKWVSGKSGVQLLPWDAYKARSYVKAKTSTKEPREFAGITRDISAFYVSWAGGVNALFDMAGRQNKSVMAANLTGKFGPPSRIMWPAAEKNAPEVEEQMRQVIERVMDEYNKRNYGAG